MASTQVKENLYTTEAPARLKQSRKITVKDAKH